MSDSISRADAIEAVLGLAQLNGRVPTDSVIFQIKALPSAEAVEVKADQLPPKVPTEWINDGMVLVPQHDWIEMQKKLEEYASADAVSDAYKRGFDDCKRAYEIELARSADAVHESCEDCPLYDTEKHSCPRFNKVIPRTIAEAVQGWIPCSERLPKESGDYLCTIPLDADETYTEVLTFHKGRFYEDDDEWGATYHDDVLAWMPLPKPYKESEVEE